VLIGEVGGFWRYKTAGNARPLSGRREGGRVKKLKILVATLAMTLLFAAPAFAQRAGDESAVVEVGDVDTIATASNVLDGEVVLLRKHGVGVGDVELLRKHGV
jgi:hypothetical protein